MVHVVSWFSVHGLVWVTLVRVVWFGLKILELTIVGVGIVIVVVQVTTKATLTHSRYRV